MLSVKPAYKLLPDSKSTQLELTINVAGDVVKEASEDVSEPEAQFDVTLNVYAVPEVRPVMVCGLITYVAVPVRPVGSVYSISILSAPPTVLSTHVTVALSEVVDVTDSVLGATQEPAAGQAAANGPSAP